MPNTIIDFLVEQEYLSVDWQKNAFVMGILRQMIAGGAFFSATQKSYIVNIPGSHLANVETTQLGDLSRIPSIVNIVDVDSTLLSLVSDSADDTLEGTGAQKIDVVYCDTEGVQKCKIVDMDGVTAVPLGISDIDSIQWIHVSQKGSNTNGVAIGNISLVDTDTELIVYEYISAGGNQSLTAHWHVPSGGIGVLFDWSFSALKKGVEFYLRATAHRCSRELTSDSIFLFQDFAVGELSTVGTRPLGPLYLPAGCKVKISCKADAAGGVAGGSFAVGWIPVNTKNT